LTKKRQAIAAALAAFGKAYGKGTSARKLSTSTRARIAAAKERDGQFGKRRRLSRFVGNGRSHSLREGRSQRRRGRDGRRWRPERRRLKSSVALP